MEIRDARFAGRLLASFRSGIVAIDARGAVAAVNGEAKRVLGGGRDPAAWLGRPCQEALAAQPGVARLLLDALDGRDRPVRTELALGPGEAGGPRTIGFTLTPIRGETGVEGAVMLLRDLTPYEREGEQRRLQERLAALGQMAAGLAHEIRNPLASMEVLAGLLKRRLCGAEELALLEELTGELRSLAATVTASLDFVRPAAPARSALDPVELLEESLALARSRVPYEGAIERRYADACPTLRADGDQLRAVVTNLIVNALESMAGVRRAGGHRLELGLSVARGDTERAAGATSGEPAATERGPVLVLSVSDTGAGIPPELRERVFYPFFTTKQRGSGVGLANAQKVVASHGGSIELESRQGVGSRFAVRLPVAERAP